jgi:hypothetical protein
MIFGEKKPDQSNGSFCRPLLRVGSGAITIMLVALAVACTVHESRQYIVQVGNCSIYGRIYQKPTRQILSINDNFCRGDVNCTADLLGKYGNFSGRGAAEWHQALRQDRGTLKSSLDRIRAGSAKCLVLKKDICPPNFGNTNFEVSSNPSWCKIGQPF